MIIGIPKEIKNQEYRVGLTPSQVKNLVGSGHQVLVEKTAGNGVGFDDDSYQIAGAVIIEAPGEIFKEAQMIVKVKEPQNSELAMLQPEQILFTYLHLAPNIEQTNNLLATGVTAIAYETVSLVNGCLPLLAPMSEVAGRMSIQAAAHHLEKRQYGKGILMAGIPGVDRAQVLILGAGIVGKNALQMAIGMGAQVTIVDKNMDRLRDLDLIYGNRIQTAYADQAAIERLFPQVDVVIGGVLIPGGTAPQLLKREHLGVMQDGAVIVDVAIDQGGCFETSHATTHDEPTFIVDGIVHYCVANMPGAVPRTSTLGLTNATFPYISSLANFGLRQVVQGNDALRRGVTSYQGHLTCNAVAKSQHRQCMAIEDLIH